MKKLSVVAANGLILLSLAVQIDVSAATDSGTQAAESTSCRRVMAGRDTTGKVYCGTASQWAEFDRRAVQINAGVTCRAVHTPSELCMTAAQWKDHDRSQRARSEWNSTFNEIYGSSIGDMSAGAAREQMEANLQSHYQAMIPPAAPGN